MKQKYRLIIYRYFNGDFKHYKIMAKYMHHGNALNRYYNEVESNKSINLYHNARLFLVEYDKGNGKEEHFVDYMGRNKSVLISEDWVIDRHQYFKYEKKYKLISENKFYSVEDLNDKLRGLLMYRHNNKIYFQHEDLLDGVICEDKAASAELIQFMDNIYMGDLLDVGVKKKMFHSICEKYNLNIDTMQNVTTY